MSREQIVAELRERANDLREQGKLASANAMDDFADRLAALTASPQAAPEGDVRAIADWLVANCGTNLPLSVDARMKLLELQAALASPQVQGGEAVPDCPRIEYGQQVYVRWRDSQGRRCSTWVTAQEIGDMRMAESERRAAATQPTTISPGLPRGWRVEPMDEPKDRLLVTSATGAQVIVGPTTWKQSIASHVLHELLQDLASGPSRVDGGAT